MLINILLSQNDLRCGSSTIDAGGLNGRVRDDAASNTDYITNIEKTLLGFNQKGSLLLGNVLLSQNDLRCGSSTTDTGALNGRVRDGAASNTD